jgi:hypothetical protein
VGAKILDTGCTIQCPHGGQATLTTANSKVQVGGNYALLATDMLTISGCTFTVPPGTPMPCLTIQWSAPATKVMVTKQPVLLDSSVGLCINAAGAPQGTATVSGPQTKVSGA